MSSDYTRTDAEHWWEAGMCKECREANHANHDSGRGGVCVGCWCTTLVMP